MKRRRIVAAFALAAAMPAASPALACMSGAPLELEDVSFADTVVVGRIVDYRMVLDPKIRRELGQARIGTAEGNRSRFMPDYARFDILVDEVLRGEAGSRISVTWDNSTFAEPESMPPGPYLVALRRSSSDIPPLRGPSATIAPSPDPALPEVLQAPCSVPFIFESGSKEAAAVRTILARRPGAG